MKQGSLKSSYVLHIKHFITYIFKKEIFLSSVVSSYNADYKTEHE